MQAVTPMTLHMDNPMILERVYAKQNDKLSRYILADLFAGASAWTPPEDAAAIIRYRKPDGTSGFYDVDEAGRTAVTRDGSSVRLYLAEQVLTVPGVVPMELNFYSPDGGKLTSFAWELIVRPSVVTDDAIQSTDYYNGLTATVTQAVQAASAASASARASAESAESLSQHVRPDGTLTATGLTLDNPLGIAYGGTGAATAADANSNLFGVNRFASTYPDKPGIYATSKNIFTHMVPINYFGLLVIFSAGYGLHLYIDAAMNLYYGWSGDSFDEPKKWQKITATIQT